MQKAPAAAARIAFLSAFIALAALFMAIALPSLAQAADGRGGLTAYEYEPTPTEPAESPLPTEPGAPEEIPPSGEAGRATLVNGRAIPPADAPTAVRQAIAAANKIRSLPYIWGGGHGRWWDRGYDCSGAVSFALHGGRLLTSPLPSGSMETWGAPGRGRWITVYANAGHAYAVIAGLRWDTAGNERGESGPRWHEGLAPAAGGRFVARHPIGY
jgi:cell wall-associated NlpC family hydrolase